MVTIARIPFPWMLGIVAALVIVVDAVGTIERLGLRTLYLLAIPIVLAVWYLLEYRTLPMEEKPTPVAPVTPAAGLGATTAADPPNPDGTSASSTTIEPPIDPNEPFDDPVEEADRIESEEKERSAGQDDAPPPSGTT